MIWRSGSQIVAQMIQWAATFAVIRILNPADYGLFAMTQVVLVFLNMLNGYGLASGLVRAGDASPREIRQLFGLLIVVNGVLALVQIGCAPLAAAYYHQPIVADLLRVQALIYLTTPFIVLPTALLSRAMDFRAQAKVNLLASLASAATAFGGAIGGLGVWTLVAAPIVLFAVRGAGLTIAAGGLTLPVFDFRGIGHHARFGAVLAVGQLFWFAQSQADVLIAGRRFDAHELGLYTTALFLTQIFVAKVVPPLNEVAFSAYARIQDDPAATAAAFAKSVRVIFAAAMPFYLGLAATAEPLVLTVLGPKWADAAPLVRLLALAMPAMTLNVLFSPVTDALGRPDLGVRNGAVGGAILIAAFLIGVRWDGPGLATAWIVAYPLYLAVSMRRSLPVIGVRAREVAAAILPSALAATAMAAAVIALDALLPALATPLRLAVLVATGGAIYAAWLAVFARTRLDELAALVTRRRVAAAG